MTNLVNKKIQTKTSWFLILLVSFSILVIASNTTINESLNESVEFEVNISEIVEVNDSLTELIENDTILNEFIEDNLSVDVSNISEEEVVEINELIIDESENFDKMILENEHKLNEQTKNFLMENDKNKRNNFIIKYKPGFDRSKLDKFSKLKNLDKVKISKFESNLENIKEILDDDFVEFVEIDQNIELLGDFVPFNIKQINADNAWNFSKGAGVKVALLDTGIENHNDLSVSGGWNILDNNSDYSDSEGHGTAVAGVLASLINDQGLVGVSPEVSLYAIKIMPSGSLSDAIEGVEWAIDNNMNIVSMSFGYYGYSQIFKEVLEEAYNDGLLLVGASGNDNSNVLYPAAYTSVIAVGAVNSNNEKASFSNYGFELELVAPGVNINSTSLNNDYNIISGTSISVPHVVGVSALIWSDNLSNEDVRGKLQNDAVDLGSAGKDDYYGYGLVKVNLTGMNYNFTPLSYFYEVFNVTDYNLPNETLSFWLNGTGTIDDINFKEGIYFIIKNWTSGSSKRYYNVSANGTLKLLASVYFNDDFTSDSSTSSDGKAWKNGNLQVKLGDAPVYLDAQCYDYDGDGDYEECFYDHINDYSSCSAYSSGLSGDKYAFYDICENRPNDCNEGANGDSNNFQSISTSSINYDSVYIVYYVDCDDSESELDSSYENGNFYIFDKRKAICQSSLQVQYYGRYTTTPSWSLYKTKNCPSNKECDYAVDNQETTSKTSNIDPCRLKNGESCTTSNECLTGVSCIGGICGGTPSPKCNGTINIVTSDSGLNIKIDNVYKGTTDELYFLSEDIEDSATCGTPFNVSVYCSDNSTLCYNEVTYFSENEELVTVVDSDCDKTCSADKNFWITNKDVEVSGDVISVTLHSADISGNVNITLYRINKNTGLKDGNKTLSFNIGSRSTAVENTTWVLNQASAVNFYVDEENNFVNDDKNDNFVYRVVVQDKPKTYLSINTSYPEVDSLLRTYLRQYVINTTENNADLIISVGKNTPYFESYNSKTLSMNQTTEPYVIWGYENGKIVAHGKTTNKIYSGIVGRTLHVSGKPIVLAYGIGISGDIASVKKLISTKDLMFSGFNYPSRKPKFLDDYDILALGVHNILKVYSNYSSPSFLSKVDKILYNNAYDVSIKPVKTLNTTSYNMSTILRVKNVNSDFSDDFQDAISETAKPVVLSRGLWSNLFTWQDFGRELASKGRDTWLIEITGGPTQDCPTCPNYNYSDLVDFYWPALIGGIQAYTGEDKIDYVGFSNGCRVGLSSLENLFATGKNNAGYYFDYDTGQYVYSNLSINPVETFVGVGCPGAFEGDSLFADCLLDHGEAVLDYFKSRGITHSTMTEFAKRLQLESTILHPYCFILASRLRSDGRISRNLGEQYQDWIESDQDQQPGKNLNLASFLILYGTNGLAFNNNNDYIVTEEDALDIFNNIISNDKDKKSFHLRHNELADNLGVRQKIKEVLI